MSELMVTRNDADHRYEGTRDGDQAVIEFHLREDTEPTVMVMTHTEVPSSMRGQGVGSELVRKALDDVRERGETVLSECPYVSRWLEEHPDYQDLQAPAAA